MKNQFQILVIGGGNAGLSVAARLLRKRPGLSIGIIEPSDKHYYQPAWTLVGAGVFDIHKTVKKEADYIPKGSTWIKTAAASFQPEKNQVTCSNGEIYQYEILVVCPGIKLDWDRIKGAREAVGKKDVTCNYAFEAAPHTWEMIRDFKGGTAVFTNPPTPVKCGGAPHKIMYLACDYWRQKGILDRCDVHYVSGGGILFGIKEYAATLHKAVEKYGIKTHFKCNTIAVDGEKNSIQYEQKDEQGNTVTKEMHFDFCHVVPPQSAPDFIHNSPIADPQSPYGYVEVDKFTLQHVRYPNIFSLGDSSNAPCSKTGAAIRKQAPVVAANILSVLDGQKPVAQYKGYSACPIPTAYGKLMLAEFDYSNTPTMTFPFDQAKPRWTMWVLKKYILPWLYWHRILKGAM